MPTTSLRSYSANSSLAQVKGRDSHSQPQLEKADDDQVTPRSDGDPVHALRQGPLRVINGNLGSPCRLGKDTSESPLSWKQDQHAHDSGRSGQLQENSSVNQESFEDVQLSSPNHGGNPFGLCRTASTIGSWHHRDAFSLHRERLTPDGRLSRQFDSTSQTSIDQPGDCGRLDLNRGGPVKLLLRSFKSQKLGPSKLRPVGTSRFSLEDDSEVEGKADVPGDRPSTHFNRKKSGSWSSGDFIAAVKSAADIVGSTNFLRNGDVTDKPVLFRRHSRMSTASGSEKISASLKHERMHDPQDESSSKTRSAQRWQVFEELVNSEESYLNDLKILAHVYFTILASAANGPQLLNLDVQRNLSNLISLHDKLYGHMLSLMRLRSPPGSIRGSRKRPRAPSEDEFLASHLCSPQNEKGAIRRSFEAVRFRSLKTKCFGLRTVDVITLTKLFDREIQQFYLYEEYGARYNSMLSSVNATSKTIANWSAYERGIEAFMNALGSPAEQMTSERKSLTLEDLLIKPIQRICKYPLLLAEMLRYCPSTEDPAASQSLRVLLETLRDAAQATNRATNDKDVQLKFRRLWLLEEMLEDVDTLNLRNSISCLGSLNLCGVLFVAYATEEGVIGSFMLSAIIGYHLLLAKGQDHERCFRVKGLIDLRRAQLYASNARTGLHCRSVPFSWKISFCIDSTPYEVIFCAVSKNEEAQWKGIMENHTQQPVPHAYNDQQNFLATDLTAKRLDRKGAESEDQSPRLQEQNNVRQEVRIENTIMFSLNDSSKESKDNSPRRRSSTIRLANEIVGAEVVPVLTADRHERAKLEQALESVWTKERLPYPTVSPRRNAAFIRASTRTVMRKLSRTSTSSHGSRRAFSSPGLANLDPFVEHQEMPETEDMHPTKAEISPVHTNDQHEELFIGQQPQFDQLAGEDEPFTYQESSPCLHTGSPLPRVRRYRSHKDLGIDSPDDGFVRDQESPELHNEAACKMDDEDQVIEHQEDVSHGEKDAKIRRSRSSRRAKALFKSLAPESMKTWLS